MAMVPSVGTHYKYFSIVRELNRGSGLCLWQQLQTERREVERGKRSQRGGVGGGKSPCRQASSVISAVAAVTFVYIYKGMQGWGEKKSRQE